MTEPTSPAPDDGLPLFDERYRWVLLHELRWLRGVPEVDLDDPEQLEAAYGFLSDFVQRSARRRGLAAKLDPVRVAAIVESGAARSTVEKILISWLGAEMSRPPWQEFLKKPEIQEMLAEGADALEAGKLEQRVQEKRMELAKSFGLHAQITDVSVSKEGDVRLSVAFDQDIAFVPDDLKELMINGVPLAGAQFVEVRRNDGGRPAVEAVISVNVAVTAIPALKVRPLSVCAMTKEDVRLKAIKMV